jgi:hypothetical protein
MSAMAGTAEIFTRKASGLVRVMSPYSAFIYNILTMGIIFPWVFLVSPTAFPGGNVPLGILICTLIQIPIAYSAVWLSTALPRSGGDYVFQSRVLGGSWGFSLVLSGFVIWILVWTALSGWLVATLGLAPLLLGFGTVLRNAALIQAGVWVTTPTGLFVVSLVNGALGALLLVRGFKNYVRFQHVIWWGTLLGFAAVLLVLFTSPVTSFATNLNQFAAAVGESPTFYQDALATAQAAGVNTAPSFGWLLTLLIAPVAWQSLQWSTYSAEQNGEIKEARSFRNQSFIMVGSLIVAGLLLALLGLGCRGSWHRRPGGGLVRLLVCRSDGQDRRHHHPGAEHAGRRHHPQRFVDPHHRHRLHPQRLPDRLQLLHRGDAHHGGDEPRPVAAGLDQQGSRAIPYSVQRSPAVLPAQHPDLLSVQLLLR